MLWLTTYKFLHPSLFYFTPSSTPEILIRSFTQLCDQLPEDLGAIEVGELID